MNQWPNEGETSEVVERQDLTRFGRFCHSLEPLFTPRQFRFCLFVAILTLVLLLVAAIIAALRPPNPAIYPQIWAFPPFFAFWYATLYGMFRFTSWQQREQQVSMKERYLDLPFGRFLVASQPDWVWNLSDFFEKHLSRYFLMIFVVGPLLMAVLRFALACS